MHEFSDLTSKLIAAQQNNEAALGNLVQILIWVTVIVSASAAIVGLGLLRYVRNLIRVETLSRIERELRESFQHEQHRIAEMNNQFISALDEFSSLQTTSKIRAARQESSSGRPLDEAWLLTAIGELIYRPLRLKDDVQAIAYRRDEIRQTLARIRALWAEVKAGNVPPRSARRLVRALVPLVEMKHDPQPALNALSIFLTQLENLIQGSAPLPSEPGF